MGHVYGNIEWCINSLGSVPASSRCLVNLGCIRILGMWCILPSEMVQYFMGSMSILDRGSHCSKGAFAYCHFLCIVGSTNEKFPYSLPVRQCSSGHNDQQAYKQTPSGRTLAQMFVFHLCKILHQPVSRASARTPEHSCQCIVKGQRASLPSGSPLCSNITMHYSS